LPSSQWHTCIAIIGLASVCITQLWQVDVIFFLWMIQRLFKLQNTKEWMGKLRIRDRCLDNIKFKLEVDVSSVQYPNTLSTVRWQRYIPMSTAIKFKLEACSILVHNLGTVFFRVLTSSNDVDGYIPDKVVNIFHCHTVISWDHLISHLDPLFNKQLQYQLHLQLVNGELINDTRYLLRNFRDIHYTVQTKILLVWRIQFTKIGDEQSASNRNVTFTLTTLVLAFPWFVFWDNFHLACSMF
jgi:hypothetical protein